MIITFIGHRNFQETGELRKKIIGELAKYKTEERICYCGGYGNFDLLCARIVNELRLQGEQICSAFVSPYIVEGYQTRLKTVQQSGLYDEILYPPIENVPYKFAISKRNEWMIDAAELIIAYVEREWGGAYAAIVYAKRKGKKIVNLATFRNTRKN